MVFSGGQGGSQKEERGKQSLISLPHLLIDYSTSLLCEKEMKEQVARSIYRQVEKKYSILLIPTAANLRD